VQVYPHVAGTGRKPLVLQSEGGEMTVYVDDVRHRFGRMIMSHMWADSLGELMAMADRIGVARKRLQQPPKASWVHFDISLDKKARAIAAGAVLTDKYGPLEFLAKRAIASGDPKRVAAGQTKLDDIARCRAMGRVKAAG
jgi:Protein of unknown function (DUF4031)